MADNQNPSPRDPRLTDGIRRVAQSQSALPDELTRARHLKAMRRAGVSYRRRLSVVATAAALIAGFVAVTAVSGGSGNDPARNIAAPATVAPLKDAPALSAVPFERSEDYVILKVDASRADEVGAELEATLGAQPSVVGITKSATTYVVPASAAAKLSATSGITAVADTPIKMTGQQNPVPSWGLDRLDSSTLDGSYSYISEGGGAYVYVIDTGIYGPNSDFGGRVVSGYTAVADGNGTTDCNGHGTHVAGTVAGTNYGVAKSATLVAVRVLDCNGSGYSSSVVAGINWVIASHPGGAGVINLSLGGAANSAVDQAVADATAAGLVVVVAAGNSSADACNYSPSRAPSALTIGAIDQSNAKASYSNSGSCVDAWAPGSNITSDGIGGSATMSGTSMASPHVAGLAARMMQARPGISASSIRDIITASSLSNDPAGLPIAEFVEDPGFASTTTSVLDTTTTLDPGVTTTVVDTTTTVPGVTTTLPAVTTTTLPRATTTTVAGPRPTVPKPGDDDDKDKVKQPRKRFSPQPKNFSLRYNLDDRKKAPTVVLYALWQDDGTPDSYRIDCASLVKGLNAPVDTSILIDKSTVRSDDGYRQATVVLAPTYPSRCWIIAITGGTESAPSNPAILPPAPRAVPPTTTTVPRVVTTTTVPRIVTTTTVPRIITTTTAAPVAPTTTVAAAKAPATTVKATTTTSTVPKAPPTTAKKKDD